MTGGPLYAKETQRDSTAKINCVLCPGHGADPAEFTRSSRPPASLFQEWVEANRRVYTSDIVPDEYHSAGEHLIWYSEDTKAVYKLTHSGRYGFSNSVELMDEGEDGTDLRFGVRSATLDEYLLRLYLHNEEFGDDFKIQGLVQHGYGEVSILVSQSFIDGGQPTLQELGELMGHLDYIEVANGVFFHPQHQVLASDVFPRNFIRHEEACVPIDIIMGYPSEHEQALLRDLVTRQHVKLSFD